MATVPVQINLYWLQTAANEITNGNLTVTNAAKNAQFILNGITFSHEISPATLRKLFTANNITYKAKPGREEIKITEQIENLIINYQLNLKSGEKVTYYTLILDYPQVPFIAVRKTFIKFNLYKYKNPQKKEKPRCRYEAKFVNQIWHADIHYFQKPGMPNVKYLYAIMDDKSRFIVGWQLLTRKKAEDCVKVLKSAINTFGPPSILWTDNGGENTGQFMLNFLKINKIYPVTTEPYNPQQNGKIERFWQKLEDWTITEEDVEKYIYQYNNCRASMALKNGNYYLRPRDVFFNLNLRWHRDYEWKWFIDGNESFFPFDAFKKSFYYD